MPTQSCWITTEGERHHLRRYTLAFACAGCTSCHSATIERERDGTVLSRYGSAFPHSKRLLYKQCWVPTEGESALISCVYCGLASVVCQFSRVGGGISFTVLNSSNVTKGHDLQEPCVLGPKARECLRKNFVGIGE
jgi:hypothetical protein